MLAAAVIAAIEGVDQFGFKIFYGLELLSIRQLALEQVEETHHHGIIKTRLLEIVSVEPEKLPEKKKTTA